MNYKKARRSKHKKRKTLHTIAVFYHTFLPLNVKVRHLPGSFLFFQSLEIHRRYELANNVLRGKNQWPQKPIMTKTWHNWLKHHTEMGHICANAKFCHETLMGPSRKLMIFTVINYLTQADSCICSQWASCFTFKWLISIY